MRISIRQYIPVWLTLSRIMMTPLIVVFYYSDFSFAKVLAVITLLLAGSTDFFDGYLARIWKVGTNLGRFLDPIADKLLTITVLLLIVGNTPGILYVAVAAAIICREVMVVALRQWLAESNQPNKADVSIWGKLKTAIQIPALACVLLNEKIGYFHSLEVGTVLLVIVMMLAFFSLFLYTKEVKIT